MNNTHQNACLKNVVVGKKYFWAKRLPTFTPNLTIFTPKVVNFLGKSWQLTLTLNVG